MNSNISITENEHLLSKMNELDTKMKDLYLPTHFKNVMTKIGKMEAFINKTESSVNKCYGTIFSVFVMFLIFLAAVCFVIYKVNYIRFLSTPDIYRRVFPPRRSHFKRRSYSYTNPPIDYVQSSPE